MTDDKKDLENPNTDQELNSEIDNALDEAVPPELDDAGYTVTDDSVEEEADPEPEPEENPGAGYTVTDESADESIEPESELEESPDAGYTVTDDSVEDTPDENIKSETELSSNLENPVTEGLDDNVSNDSNTDELDIDALGEELDLENLGDKEENTDKISASKHQASDDLQNSDKKLDEAAVDHPLDGSGEKSSKKPGKNKKLKIVVFSTILLLVLVGGGELFYSLFSHSARSFEVNLTSTPSGATVIIDGKEAGISPLKIKLKAGKHKVEFQRNGYAPIDELVTVDKDGKVISKELKPSSDSTKANSK